MDLSTSKRPKKPLTPKKKTPVLTTTFAFIAVNQDTELWTIKLRLTKSISLHQLPLLRHQQKPPLLSKFPHNNKAKLKPWIQSLAKTSRFSISDLTLTPTSSVEISNNKHLVSRCTIKFNELSDEPIILFDTDVTGEVFMDKKYAQQRGIRSIFLIRPIPLQGFDGNATGSGLVIHFVYIFFVPFGHKPQFTHLFLIDIPQFPIIISLPWMRSKFTTIRLKPDISTINFEQLDKINEPVTTPETMESHSLTKIGNLKQPSSLLLAKSGNYRPFSVKKIPDERKLEELPIFKKKISPDNATKNEKKHEFWKKGKTLQGSPTKNWSKKNFLRLRSKSKL